MHYRRVGTSVFHVPKPSWYLSDTDEIFISPFDAWHMNEIPPKQTFCFVPAFVVRKTVNTNMEELHLVLYHLVTYDFSSKTKTSSHLRHRELSTVDVFEIFQGFPGIRSYGVNAALNDVLQQYCAQVELKPNT